MKKIKKNEATLIDLEQANTIDQEKSSLSPKLSKKNTTKFSMSNENEFLFNSRERQRSHKKLQINLPKIQPKSKKIFEYKAKSEEKYSGSPGYQIFIARNPILQSVHSRMTYNLEKRVNKFLTNVSSPESASLRRFKKDSYDIFEENRSKFSIKMTECENRYKKENIKSEQEADFMENTGNYEKKTNFAQIIVYLKISALKVGPRQKHNWKQSMKTRKIL